jgi:RNA polymerase sigma-70 factor (ECF subfamily)
MRVAHWCYRASRDRELVFDLAQEIFMRAFRSFHTFRGDCRFSTWLYVITRNHCGSVRKKRHADPVVIDEQLAAQLPDAHATDFVESIDRDRTTKRQIRRIRAILTGTEQRVMMLHYGEGVPLAAITRTLGLTNRSGAKAYIVSARRKLRPAGRKAADSSR